MKKLNGLSLFSGIGGVEMIKTYIETKIVRAKKCADRSGKSEGYKVIYPCGYESWCPKDIFEQNNREITNEEKKYILSGLL